MDPIAAVMIARIEHRLMVERAEQPWRHMKPAGRHRARGAGLLARVRATLSRPRLHPPERAGTGG